MTMEQRLIEAFRSADRVEPSRDLWARVVHSIDENREHRRRVRGTIVTVLATAGALVTVGALAIEAGQFGRFVNRPLMEALEAIALVTLLVVLGPAIRRFGRGYASDLWPAGSTTASGLLRLLDVAYYLVGAGYILISTKFEFADGLIDDRLADQLAGASVRIGGLLLLFGVLHATTLLVLPVVALVDNATRTNRPLAHWVFLFVLAAGFVTILVVRAAIEIGISG
ncbi:MAG: hypothetical protein ABIP17_07605 [Ilumatobacteraceae bacterium]